MTALSPAFGTELVLQFAAVFQLPLPAIHLIVDMRCPPVASVATVVAIVVEPIHRIGDCAVAWILSGPEKLFQAAFVVSTGLSPISSLIAQGDIGRTALLSPTWSA